MRTILKLMLIFSLMIGIFACSKSDNKNSSQKNAQKSSLLERVKKRGYIAVALEPSYLPFEMKTKSGELIGFDVEMVQLLAKSLGVKAKFVFIAYDGIIPSLMMKNGDKNPVDMIVSGMTITEKRAKKVQFSDPYFRTGQAFFVSNKSKMKIKSYKDLNQKGLIIATTTGVTAEFTSKKLFPKATLKLFKKEDLAAIEVLNARADVMVFDQPYIAAFSKKNAAYVKAFLKPFTDESLGIALRKKDKDLLKAVNAFIKKFKNSEKYKELYKKYFIDMPWFYSVENK